MILETLILAGLAKVGCILTAVKVFQWRKRGGKLEKEARKLKKPRRSGFNKRNKC